jgi:hypothetical protein
MRARLALVATLVACNNPSRLDSSTQHVSTANDPWAATLTTKHDGNDKDGNGIDVQGTLARIREGLEKPGPYEMPDRSQDYDADKPHWGACACTAAWSSESRSRGAAATAPSCAS